MASGSCTTTSYVGQTYTRNVIVNWSSTNDTTNNKSTITWSATAGGTTSGYIVSGPITVKINGTTVLNITSRIQLTYGYNLGSGTITVSHNADGTKDVRVYIGAAIYYGSVNCTYDNDIHMTQNRVYALTKSISNGSITVDRKYCAGTGSTGAVEAGTKVFSLNDTFEITATPNSNYSVTSLTVTGAELVAGSSTRYKVTGNVSIAATTQALSSTVSASPTSVDIGSTTTVSITKHNSSYAHSLYYKFTGDTGTVTGYITSGGGTSQTEVKFTGTSVTWTVPNTFLSKLSSSTSGKCVITCKTYASTSSTTQIGSSTTATITANGKLSTISLGSTSANINDPDHKLHIDISKYKSSYAHSLYYHMPASAGGTEQYGYITSSGGYQENESKFTGTSIDFELPQDLYAAIPKTTSGTVTITCYTYTSTSAGTALGSTTKTFTANTVQSLARPSVSLAVEDINSTTISLTNNSRELILNRSRAQVTTHVSNVSSSPIKSKTLNGSSLSLSVTTRTYTNVGYTSFTLTATDSRGYSNSATKSPTVYPYTPVSCTATITRHSSSSATATSPTGSYLKISATGSFYCTSSGGASFGYKTNDLKIQYMYRQRNQNGTWPDWPTTWTNVSINSSNTTYNATTQKYTLTATAISGEFPYTNEYEFKVKATDGRPNDSPAIILSSATHTVSGVGGTPVFDWGKSDFMVNVPLRAQILEAYQSATNGGRSRIIVVENINFNDAGTSTNPDASVFIEAWLKKLCADYPSVEHTLFIGRATPGSSSFVMCYVYNTSVTQNGLPQYAHGVYYPYTINYISHYRFFTYEYAFSCYEHGNRVSTGTVTYTTNSVITSAANLGITLRKVGRVVTMDFQPTVAAVASGSSPIAIAQIDNSAFYPQSQVALTVPQQATSFYFCGVYVTAGGEIRILKNNTSTGVVRANLSWIASS